MDAGIWTLKCQNCRQTFALDLSEGDEILTAVKTAPCPLCNKSPASDKQLNPARTWHQIVDFKSAKNIR
jgi:hypothetical protein